MPLEYTPLDVKRSEIRLLTILPAIDFSDPINCRLHTVSLNEVPDYEALSYCWGDPTATRQVLVQDSPVNVTINLAEALRHLRLQDQHRIFWIDAICINQKHDEEKSSQIPLMGRIYGSADLVVTWLGPSDTELRAAFDWIGDQGGLKLRIAAVLSPVYSEAQRQTDVKRVLHEGFLVQQGLNAIFGHAYWRRMWTYQEFYAQPNIEPVLICGHKQLKSATGKIFSSYEMLLRNINELRDKLDDPAQDVGMSIPLVPADDKLFYGFQQMVVNTAMRECLHLDKSWSKLTNERAHSTPNARTRHDKAKMLLDLLDTVHLRECFDPRDNIYALYGLVSGLADDLPPDYSKCHKQAFWETTKYILLYRGMTSLESLMKTYHLAKDRLLSKTSVCPSWVPDFSSSPTRWDDTGHDYRPIVTSSKELKNGLSAGSFLTPVGTLILSEAILLGVCKVELRFARDAHELARQLFVFEKNERNVARQPDQHLRTNIAIWAHTFGRSETITDSAVRNTGMWYSEVIPEFVESLTVGTVSSRLSCYSGLASTLSNTSTESEAATKAGEAEEEYDFDESGTFQMWHTNFERLRGRTLFSTLDGQRLGIAARHVQDGDMVALIGPVAWPVILRESKEGVGETASTTKSCRIASLAYVDGVMDNEAREPELCMTLLSKQRTTVNII